MWVPYPPSWLIRLFDLSMGPWVIKKLAGQEAHAPHVARLVDDLFGGCDAKCSKLRAL